MKKSIIFMLLLLILTIANTQARAANFTVTRTDDRNATCVSGVDCSLREAVAAANANPLDDTINFDAALNGQVIVLANQLSLGNAGILTITGLGAKTFTVNAGPGNNGIFSISPNASVNITDVTLRNGKLAGGGGSGGAVAAGTNTNVTLDRVFIRDNNGISGGGVFLETGTLIIRNSTIASNQATNGGGILVANASLTVVNSTITGNTASNGGGGIESYNGSVTLRNSTITSNTGTIFSGGLEVGSMTPNSLNMANTILAGNTSPQFPDFFLGANATSQGNNLVTQPLFTGAGTMTYQMSDVLNTSPLLAPLQYYGGKTPTRALQTGSPAIDAGSNSQAVDPSNGNTPLLLDQRGFNRFVNGALFGVIADIGAYEYSAPPTAATVSVGGRVILGKSSFAARATVSLTDMQGNVKTARVNPFGYYKFEDISAGQTVIVEVSAKGAIFAPQVVTVNENIEDLNFSAQ